MTNVETREESKTENALKTAESSKIGKNIIVCETNDLVVTCDEGLSGQYHLPDCQGREAARYPVWDLQVIGSNENGTVYR